MRVQVVGAAADTEGHPLSTFIIDGVLAVDAGALGWFAAPVTQSAIRDVLLTHAHIDHVAGLPGFIESVYRLADDAPTVHAPEPTLRALQDHIFNDVLMPDFVAMSETMHPFVRLSPVEPGRTFGVGRYHVTAIELDHVIPTVAYRIDDGSTAVAVVTDTAPVPMMMADLATLPRLRAVFLEASFPNSMGQLATVSKHLTSEQFLAAARALPPTVAVYAIHVKPRFYPEVRAEIEAAGLPNVRIAVPGEVVVAEPG